MDEAGRRKLWDSYMRNRAQDIREKLILEYAPLVKVVAGRLSMYLGYNVEYDDLVSYGIFGLIDAIDKFDNKKDVKFETYASLRIRGAILDQIRQMDWSPRTVRQKQKKIDTAIREIESATGQSATDEQIAAKLEISEDELSAWHSQMKVTNLVSLNEYMETGSEIGFDTERFAPDRLAMLPTDMPRTRAVELYHDLNDLLEHDVLARYYMASGYLETLVKHRERQEGKGYGFGYRIVNAEGIERPIANTLLATGGSGRERNLIYDPKEGIAGQIIKGKKTPLNDKGIRVMTPTEWGKLQGFINYGFVNAEGEDEFSFPEGIPAVQQYKQFGNSVTIPVIEEMARFMLDCLAILHGEEP